MSGLFFVDTSVWVEYFRDSGCPSGDLIDSLILDDKVAVNGVVLAELLTGAKGEREAAELAETLSGLRFLDMPAAFFERAGRHGRLLKRAGISIPLSDLLIATHCLDHDLVLIANDRHFDSVAKYLPLRREEREAKG